MKSKSIKSLRLSKNSVSNLSTILGGMDGEGEPTTGGSEAAPSTGGPSWNCDSIEVCH